jgi:phosphoserine phosphatase
VREFVLINITGLDRPGLSTALVGVLAEGGASLLDVSQAVIHGTLNLAVMLEQAPGVSSEALLERVKTAYATLDVTVRLQSLDLPAYEHWAQAQGAPRYVLSLLTHGLSAAQLHRVTGIANHHGLDVERIDRLSAPACLHGDTPVAHGCVDIRLQGVAGDAQALRADLLEAARELNVDIALQRDDLNRRHRRLAVFDMDSTLIQAEVIDELAKAYGVGERVSEITERAMRGELDFRASFKERMALLKGLDVGVLDEIGASLRLTDGAEALFAGLRRLGYKTAILSGGFTYFARQVQARLGIDYVYANELQVEDGKCTGVAVEPIVDAQRKAELLRELAAREGVSLEQTIAVGDGANDLPMLALAGLGVAFHAKPLVKACARHSISTLGLEGVLYLLGVEDRLLS